MTCIENIRKTSFNHLKNFIMILTIFVADSDRNEEALQEENCKEDGSVEGEVERHVPPARYNKILLFYLYQFSKYQFCYLPNISTDTYRKNRKLSSNLLKNFIMALTIFFQIPTGTKRPPGREL